MADAEFTTERWLPVVGYEGVYSVSDAGRVRRETAVGRYHAGRLLRPRISRLGYVGVVLHVDGAGLHRSVHHLVMAAFVGPRPAGAEVNHRDADKRNNRPSNLEYVSRAENVRHAYRLGLVPALAGELNGCAKLTAIEVRAIRALLCGGLTQIEIGKRYGVSNSTVSLIARGLKWRHVH